MPPSGRGALGGSRHAGAPGAVFPSTQRHGTAAAWGCGGHLTQIKLNIGQERPSMQSTAGWLLLNLIKTPLAAWTSMTVPVTVYVNEWIWLCGNNMKQSYYVQATYPPNPDKHPTEDLKQEAWASKQEKSSWVHTNIYKHYNDKHWTVLNYIISDYTINLLYTLGWLGFSILGTWYKIILAT